VLCPADALLHAVLHGVLAPDPRSYRWVLDGALILGGAGESFDYERLIEQARVRRLTVALRAGLRYMREIADAPVPAAVMRALSARGPRAIERLELRAWRTRPSEFRRLDRVVFYYQQCARRSLPFGARAGLVAQLKVARASFGIGGLRDLRELPRGGTPGPGRPLARGSAAVDGRRSAAAGAAVALGEELELGPGAPVPALFRYGAWVNEGDGVWLAGTEAQLALALGAPAAGSLVLTLRLVNFFAYLGRPARLELAVCDKPAGRLTVHASTPELGDARFHLPAGVVAGRSLIELTLRMPGAVSPAQLGINDNDRRIGLFLRGLVLAEPLSYSLGAGLEFGQDGSGEGALAGGWGNAERDGRWSDGPLATILLRIEEERAPLTLELTADPYLGSPPRRTRVDLIAGGLPIGRFVYGLGADWQPGPRRATVPARCIDDRGELLLALRIRDVRSPQEPGHDADDRALGLFIRGLRLTPAEAA